MAPPAPEFLFICEATMRSAWTPPEMTIAFAPAGAAGPVHALGAVRGPKAHRNILRDHPALSATARKVGVGAKEIGRIA